MISRTALEIQSKKYSIIWLKLQLLFDEGFFGGTVPFSLIKDWSLMFAGDFSDVAALDLELSTHAVNVDYKKALHDWSFKTGFNTSIQNNFATSCYRNKTANSNFDRVEFGAYGIASYDLSDSFR
jgi:hypothetical protein